MSGLECILIPTTTKEIDSGLFNNFIIQFYLFKKTNIDIIIIINNKTHKTDILPMLLPIKNTFKNIEVLYINIPPEEDIYIKNNKSSKIHIPPLGLMSGPNYLFLAGMRYCEKYMYTLLIETDCIIKPNCVESFNNYITYCGDFLISGSTYDGTSLMYIPSGDNFYHLNGVAIYKTGDRLFIKLINELEEYIVRTVIHQHALAYDCAFTKLVLDKISNAKNFNENAQWRYIYKKMLKTTLIINCSLPSDKNMDIDALNSEFPSWVILHKKN